MSILFPNIPSCVYCSRELPRGEVCPACRRKLAPLALFGRAAYPFACCGAYRYGEVIQRLAGFNKVKVTIARKLQRLIL